VVVVAAEGTGTAAVAPRPGRSTRESRWTVRARWCPSSTLRRRRRREPLRL